MIDVDVDGEIVDDVVFTDVDSSSAIVAVINSSSSSSSKGSDVLVILLVIYTLVPFTDGCTEIDTRIC